MEPTAAQPQHAHPPQPPGPKFSQVFSVTLKVILALFVISIIIGVGYGILVSIGKSSSPSSINHDFSDTYLNSRSSYNSGADDAHTKMPLSQWKRVIAEDIRGHCVRQGMTTHEVEKAVGKPTTAKVVNYGTSPDSTDKGEVWEYIVRNPISKPCSRYEGEKCADPVEYETKKATLYFSPQGNLTYPFLSGLLKPDLSETEFSNCY